MLNSGLNSRSIHSVCILPFHSWSVSSFGDLNSRHTRKQLIINKVFPEALSFVNIPEQESTLKLALGPSLTAFWHLLNINYHLASSCMLHNEVLGGSFRKLSWGCVSFLFPCSWWTVVVLGAALKKKIVFQLSKWYQVIPSDWYK